MPRPESHFYHVTTSGDLTPAPSWAEALTAAQSGGFAWLDYCEPTKEELSELNTPLGIHPLTVEDCTDSNQIPKIEDFHGNTFMLFNGFHYTTRALVIHEVDVILGANFLVTVHRRDDQGRQMLEGLDRLAAVQRESIRQGPAFLLHVLVDHVVDLKFIEIGRMEEELGEIEDGMLADLEHFQAADLLHLRRDLLAARKSLFYEREILVRINRRDCPFIGDKAIYLFRDVYDHLARCFELTETARDVVTSLMEMYLSMLNNRMAQAANQTNLTVRRLTFITTIFMPLTLLAGIGGMSEWSMMTGPSNWRIAYPLFMAGMVALGIGSYHLLKLLERGGHGGA